MLRIFGVPFFTHHRESFPITGRLAACRLAGILRNITEGRIGQALGISTVPHYILLDPDGKILLRTYDLSETAKTFRAVLGNK